jgi:hypothetical protein
MASSFGVCNEPAWELTANKSWKEKPGASLTVGVCQISGRFAEEAISE